jgi:hypothetical protein
MHLIRCISSVRRGGTGGLTDAARAMASPCPCRARSAQFALVLGSIPRQVPPGAQHRTAVDHHGQPVSAAEAGLDRLVAQHLLCKPRAAPATGKAPQVQRVLLDAPSAPLRRIFVLPVREEGRNVQQGRRGEHPPRDLPLQDQPGQSQCVDGDEGQDAPCCVARRGWRGPSCPPPRRLCRWCPRMPRPACCSVGRLHRHGARPLAADMDALEGDSQALARRFTRTHVVANMHEHILCRRGSADEAEALGGVPPHDGSFLAHGCWQQSVRGHLIRA